MATRNATGRTPTSQQPPAGRQKSAGPASAPPEPAVDEQRTPEGDEASMGDRLDRLLELIEEADGRVRSSVSILENEADNLTSASFGAFFLLQDVLPMLTKAGDVVRATKEGSAARSRAMRAAADLQVTSASSPPEPTMLVADLRIRLSHHRSMLEAALATAEKSSNWPDTEDDPVAHLLSEASADFECDLMPMIKTLCDGNAVDTGGEALK